MIATADTPTRTRSVAPTVDAIRRFSPPGSTVTSGARPDADPIPMAAPAAGAAGSCVPGGGGGAGGGGESRVRGGGGRAEVDGVDHLTGMELGGEPDDDD